jgi:hypothetical protein
MVVVVATRQVTLVVVITPAVAVVIQLQPLGGDIL